MSKRSQCDVLVVGAGPVGLATAALLSHRGLDVRIVDEAWRSTGRSYGAALHAGTLDVLQQLGVLAELEGQAHRLSRIDIFDRQQRRLSLDLAELDAAHPQLLVVPQSLLESVLEKHLAARGVQVAWHHRAASIQPGATHTAVEIDVMERASTGYAYSQTTLEVVKSLTLEARFVVGADGCQSLVRRALGIPWEEVGSSEQFDVFEFETTAAASDAVCIVVDEESTNVLWTLPRGRQRWSFQIVDPASRGREREKSRIGMQVPGESAPRYTEELLRELASQRAPWFDAPLGSIAWAGDVRFERRLAASFGQGGVWLAGDSAHQTGPIGVQSMNEGIQEAIRISEAITVAVRDPNSALLRGYANERLALWRGLLGLTDRFTPGSDADPWVAGCAKRLLPCLPLSGAGLAAAAKRIGLGS
jgi:2-polyprenyl-6-methoxyphenol hydroxylase-like FAD-dependent oxidoreductase